MSRVTRVPDPDKADGASPTGVGADGADGAPGIGLPAGGSTGQVATKASNTDYDIEWADSAGGSSVTVVLTYYVAATGGSDSNDGLSAEAPFATIAKALEVISFRGAAVGDYTIQLADGTYSQAADLTLPNHYATGQVIITGNASTPANVIINSSTTLGYGLISRGSNIGVYQIQDLSLVSAHNARLIRARNGCIVNFKNLRFGATGALAQIDASQGGMIYALANYAITGGASTHISVSSVGQFSCIGRTVTITNTPAFASGYAYATQLGYISMSGNTFTGSATGKRYSSNDNSVITTAGATLPGSTAGTTATGGIYS